MITACEVYLWGTRIGVIHQDDAYNPARFEYDQGFLKSGIELAPFMMPLSNRIYSFSELARNDAFHGLPGMFADSLPDKFGNAVIGQWLINHGRTIGSFSAIERLCYTGKRGMGALEYLPATGVEFSLEDVDVTDMVELASEILTNKEKAVLDRAKTSVAQLIEIGSSAGGARAKAVIAWNEKNGKVKSGQIDAGEGYEHWLIKFDGVSKNGDHGLVDKNQYTLIEYAYYLMAVDAGIDMMECRVMKKDGFNHFMTKRFDRVGGRKAFVQTMAALKHYDYNIPGSCSYELYADCARRLGIGKEGIKQLYKRMVFNVLSSNCDDHVKNFAFIMDRQGRWSLSPAYDLSYAYNPDNRWISEHQMKINNKSKNITADDIIACGSSMGLTKDFCRENLEMIGSVIDNWLMYAEKAGISEECAEEINAALRDGN